MMTAGFQRIIISPLITLALALILLLIMPECGSEPYFNSRWYTNQDLSVSYWSTTGSGVTRTICATFCTNDANCAAFAIYDAAADPASTTGLNTCKLAMNSSGVVSSRNPGWKVYKRAQATIRGLSLGCLQDADPRLLPDALWVSNTQVIPDTCMDYCAGLGFAYAGLQSRDLCMCGADLAFPPVLLPATECQLPCNANNMLYCGGYWANDVFETGVPGF